MPVTLSQLDSEKHALLVSLGQWPEEHLQFHPADGGWSAVQVVDHLVRTEAGILSAAQSGLATPSRISLRDRAGTWMLQRVFRSNRRVKVPPTAAAMMPAPCPSLAECAERWTQQRIALATLVTTAEPAAYRLGIFRHPVAGWMTLQGILDFFSVHIHHHSFQLAALTQALRER